MRSHPILLAIVALAPLADAQGPSYVPVPPGVDQGRAQGAWLEPGLFEAGFMQGVLTSSDGLPRYNLLANVGPIVGRTGTIDGVLTTAFEESRSIVPTKPFELMHIAGHWMHAGEDQGVFSAVIFLTIDPLPLPAVLGQLQGCFDLAPEPGSGDLSGRRRARLAGRQVAKVSATFDLTGQEADRAGPDQSADVAILGQEADDLSGRLRARRAAQLALHHATDQQADLAGGGQSADVIIVGQQADDLSGRRRARQAARRVVPMASSLADASADIDVSGQAADVADGVIVCPKGPDVAVTKVQKHLGARLAAPRADEGSEEGGLQAQKAGPKAPAQPKLAGLQRRGLFEAHWYLDS